MKKIQVSTVHQTADVEVIFVNGALISKAIRAKVALENALEGTRSMVPKCDENGYPVTDENGEYTQEVDKNGKLSWDYDNKGIRDAKHIEALHETVKTFIDELTEAFEE